MLEFCAEAYCLRAAAPFAVPDRPFAVISSKSPRMILLHAQFQQLLWNDNVYRNTWACQERPVLLCEETALDSAGYEQYSPSPGRASNPCRMTTFANPRMQLLCNDNVYKKRGGWGGVPLSRPEISAVAAVLYLRAGTCCPGSKGYRERPATAGACGA